MILLLLSNAYIKAIEIAVISGNQAVCMGASDVPLEVDIDETTGTTPFTTSWTTTNAEASIDCSDCEATTISNITEATEITLTVTDGNGFVCEEFLLIDVIEMNFVNAAGQQINHADIGHWGEDIFPNNPLTCGINTGLDILHTNQPIRELGVNGYNNCSSTSSLDNCSVLNEIEEIFIVKDPDKFFIEINYPTANVSNTEIDMLNVQIATLNDFDAPNDGYDDDLTPLRLIETDINTGVFISKSLLLTTKDMPFSGFDSDDDFAVYDGFNDIVADDTEGDRTHRATLDGGIEIKYIEGNEIGCTERIPVGNRTIGAVDERKILPIRFHVLRLSLTSSETVLGTIAQAENIIDNQVERVNILWAQAGIKLNVVDIQTFSSVFDTNDGGTINIDILEDPEEVLSFQERVDIINILSNTNTSNELQVYCTKRIVAGDVVDSGEFGGVTYGPRKIRDILPETYSDNTYVFANFTNIGGVNIHNAILAHEIGHALDNAVGIGSCITDKSTDKPLFYPSSTTAGNDVYTIKQYRRLPHTTEERCRRVRPLGNTEFTGNVLLTSY